MRLAENIGRSYEEAAYLLKRNYLSLFFESFKVRKGKIINYSLNENIKPLIEKGSIRVSPNGLPNPCLIIKQLNMEKILEALQNVSYIGVLRQRWEEIKRLTAGAGAALSVN